MSQDEILLELKKINKLLTLVNAEVIIKELEKICTTNERKMMWALMDQKLMMNDIANKVGRTPQAVSIFLTIAESLGLAKNPRNQPPYRVIDYIPPEWLDLIQLDKEKQLIENKPN